MKIIHVSHWNSSVDKYQGVNFKFNLGSKPGDATPLSKLKNNNNKFIHTFKLDNRLSPFKTQGWIMVLWSLGPWPKAFTLSLRKNIFGLFVKIYNSAHIFYLLTCELLIIFLIKIFFLFSTKKNICVRPYRR